MEKEKRKIPSIRFKGYTDDWEQRKLREHAKYRRGSFPQPYGNKEWYDGAGSKPFVQVVDVGDNLRLVDNTKQKISLLAQSKSVFVPAGKVVVTLQGSIGRVAITQYDSFVDRTLLIFDEYQLQTNEYFWAYTIQQKFEIEKQKAPGGTIKTITKEALSDFEVYLPEYEEQKKVGNFFKHLDDTIALHQRKLEILKNSKQTLLQKMFPQTGENVPEIRFPGFTEDWEQRKLGEVSYYRNGKAHEKDISKDGKYIVINSKFVSTDGNIKKYSDNLIEPMSKGEIAFVLSDVPNGRAIARTFLVTEDEKFSLNQRIAGITPFKDTDSYYLYILMNRHPYFLKFDNGVGQTNLSKAEVENFESLYPSYTEQQKIGAFFKSFDDTIALHQHELEKLKQLKQNLLNKLFV